MEALLAGERVCDTAAPPPLAPSPHSSRELVRRSANALFYRNGMKRTLIVYLILSAAVLLICFIFSVGAAEEYQAAFWKFGIGFLLLQAGLYCLVFITKLIPYFLLQEKHQDYYFFETVLDNAVESGIGGQYRVRVFRPDGTSFVTYTKTVFKTAFGGPYVSDYNKKAVIIGCNTSTKEIIVLLPESYY